MRGWLNKTPLVAQAVLLGIQFLPSCAPVDSVDEVAQGADGGLDDLEVKAASACGTAEEGQNLTLSCSAGETIGRITFAGYGTPSGSCTAGFSTGTCVASTSVGKVEAACLGKQSCTVAASNALFGDPCMGVRKRLAVTHTCSKAPTETMPVFLLAGQSNMVGNVNSTLFDQLLSELASGTASTTQSRLKSRLSDWYLNSDGGYASYGYSDAVGTLESAELMRLNSAGLVGPFLKTPLSGVMCAASGNPVGLATGCGSPFGPELVAGRYLYAKGYTSTSLIKVAQGGTTLYTDWRSPKMVAQSGGTVGPLYTQLQNRIDSLKSDPASVHPSCTTQSCRWAGFIWFQGENDSFDQVNASSYATNLPSFIADVRTRIGSNTLPVVVVQIGKWAQSVSFGATVAAAQSSVVAADANTRLVKTDDLSGFYHYDPAAQLIIGERVGIALTSMLGNTVDSCPNDPNKTEPGRCGCGVPEGSCSGGTGTCVTAKENSTALLSCAAGQVIQSVGFASYGLPTGTCPNVARGTCHASSSLSRIQSLCVNKQSCSVGANNDTFGDPCFGVFKSLAITYMCGSSGTVDNCPNDPNKTAPGACGCGVPEGTCSDGEPKCVSANESATAALSCSSGQVIKTVSFASYGTPAGTCPNVSQGTCHASSSLSKIQSLCLNRQSCSVGANNGVFGDPCGGVGKKLAARYTCSVP